LLCEGDNLDQILTKWLDVNMCFLCGGGGGGGGGGNGKCMIGNNKRIKFYF